MWQPAPATAHRHADRCTPACGRWVDSISLRGPHTGPPPHRPRRGRARCVSHSDGGAHQSACRNASCHAGRQRVASQWGTTPAARRRPKGLVLARGGVRRTARTSSKRDQQNRDAPFWRFRRRQRVTRLNRVGSEREGGCAENLFLTRRSMTPVFFGKASLWRPSSRNMIGSARQPPWPPPVPRGWGDSSARTCLAY